MKDEIKEIKIGMYTTDEILEFMTNGEGRGFMGRSMYDAIIDYITNLQEKSNNQAEEINRLYKQREKFMKKYGYLQEENERLKEQCKEWKENHKAVCIQRDNILNNIVKDTEDRIDYKSRNEKAIEYIEEQSDYISSKSGTYYMCYAERNIVLDILKGGDEE